VEVLLPEHEAGKGQDVGWAACDRLAGIWKGEEEGSNIAEDHDHYLDK